MFNFAIMNSALQKAMKSIGKEGEHAPPPSQDPLDAILHEYYVAKIGSKFFEDRSKAALENMLKEIGPEANRIIDDMIDATVKNDAGESAVVCDAQHYNLDFTTRKGAMRLDATAVKVMLQTKFGLPATAAEKVVEDCSKKSAPTKIYSVKPVRD
jgi:hypothetical protein